jgi:hypothetical protein
MRLIDTAHCLTCPDRPHEGKVRSCISRLVLREKYRPETCSPGPQLKASHEHEVISPAIGRTGIIYGANEIACGQEGTIDSPKIYLYGNNTLYSIRQGNESIFWDETAAPPNGLHYTQTGDVDGILGLYDEQ